jgi:hypothetical protein
MFELIAGIFALGLVAQVVFWVFAGLLFPLFWLWMLIDAALRADAEYPSAGSNEKIVWILLLAFFQFLAVFYFFMVFRTRQRGAPCAPVAPAAA